MLPRHTNAASTIEMLYRQHGSSLLLYASAITGERSRAQDMVHQVFLKLLENGNLRQAVDVKAYLFACVRNAALNDLKTRQRDVAIDDESAWFNSPTSDDSEELSLRRALYALPDDQRQVTILHLWGELTFSQIADHLGISSNTAASRYRYALSKLRQAMCSKEDSSADL